VNPTDWKARRPGGVTALGHDFVIPHHDGAGVVEAVGEGVDQGRIGERVWVWQAQWRRAEGTAAELVALPADRAVPLPDPVSLELGAGLGIPAMTAHRCLFADGPIEGADVLVHGGAGAVGHAAIELAHWAGARVAATVSSFAKGELARAAGADLVLDYCRENVVAGIRDWAPDGVDRIVEVDLPGNAELDARVLGDGGVVASYAVAATAFVPPRALMTLNASIRWILVYTMPDDAKAAAVAGIDRALEEGALTALPGRRFPLERTAAAHEAVRSGTTGKVLVQIGEEF
jgi:NADPH2:quinone reductase